MAKLITTTALSLIWIGSAVPTFAQSASSAPGDFEFYGHLNFGVFSVDDGFNRSTAFGDGSASPSRLGFNYSTKIGADTLRFNFETALGFSSSSSYSQGNTGFTWDYDKGDIRKVELIYETASFGVFSIGQGSMATDGAAGSDLSGTTLVNEVAVADFAGGYVFGGPNGPTDVSGVFTDYDGSRRTRVRYDTPSFGGFTVAAAWGKNALSDSDDADYYDIGTYYEGELSGAKLVAGLGYSWKDDPSNPVTKELLVGSASVLLPSGFNATLAAGSEQSGSGSYFYGKLGYRTDLWTKGETAFSIDYFSGDDIDAGLPGSSTAMGIGAVQQFDDLPVEAYVGYYRYGFDGANVPDITSVTLGGRWKF